MSDLGCAQICFQVVLDGTVHRRDIAKLAPLLNLLKSFHKNLLLAGGAPKITAHAAVADIMQKRFPVQNLVPLIHQQAAPPIIGPHGIRHVKGNPAHLVHHLGDPVHIHSDIIMDGDAAQEIFNSPDSGIDTVLMLVHILPGIVSMHVRMIDLIVVAGAGNFNIAVTRNTDQRGLLGF